MTDLSIDLATQSRTGEAFALQPQAGGTGRADGHALGFGRDVTNKSDGSTISRGMVVESAGSASLGPGLIVQATNAATDVPVGIAAHDIAVGDHGFIIQASGEAFLLTTGTVAVGDRLYTSGTSGRATATYAAGAHVIGISLNSASGSSSVWAVISLLGARIGATDPDHGNLTGLTDDDHTQYLKETDVAAKGDTFAASANDTVGVLPIGANGQVLTADSTQSLGVKWGAALASTAETVQKSLTNKSGGTVNRGDVVVVDETTNESFTTSTTLDAETTLGIVQETISNNAAGIVALVGYVDLTNTADISWSRGDYVFHGSNAKIVHGSNTRAAGAFGQFLKSGSNSSALIWGVGDQAAGAGGGALSVLTGAKAYADNTQSISDVTATAVAFNQEEYDTSGFHDNSTNNSRFTVPSGKAGKYRLTGSALLAAGASPVIARLWWKLNGTTDLRSGVAWIPSSSESTGATAVAEVNLSVGDYVELIIFQDSSGARNIGHATVLWLQSSGAVSLIGT